MIGKKMNPDSELFIFGIMTLIFVVIPYFIFWVANIFIFHETIIAFYHMTATLALLLMFLWLIGILMNSLGPTGPHNNG